MSVIDFIVGPIYIFLAYFILYFLRPSLTNKRTKKYFLTAFSAKVFGLLFFALIYEFYYGGGDTYNYFRSGNILRYYILYQPQWGIPALFTAANDVTSPHYSLLSGIFFFHSAEEWAIVRIIAVGNILSFESYLGTGVFFIFGCFLGTWRLYSTMSRLFPEISRILAYAILFAPSSIFWGSGLMKDTIAFTCSCYAIACLIDLFEGASKNIIKDIGILAVCFTLLLTIKIYIFFALLPAFGLWWFVRMQTKIKNVAIKIVVTPVLILLTVAIAYGSVLYISLQNSEFASMDSINRKLNGYHSYHTYLGGSAYSLGEINYSPTGLLRKAPEAIIVSLFRPFPFEIKNPLMFLASIESTLYLFLTLYVLYKRGLLRMFKYSISNPVATLSIIFTFVLGFIIGISSYNYGALVRFKIPLLPMYGIWLILIYYLPEYEKRDKKLLKKEKIKNRQLLYSKEVELRNVPEL